MSDASPGTDTPSGDPAPAASPVETAAAAVVRPGTSPAFAAFLGVALVAIPAMAWMWGLPVGIMAGFDCAALVHFALTLPRLGHSPQQIRHEAARLDGGRPARLGFALAGLAAIVTAVAAELSMERDPGMLALVVATLLIGWGFANLVFALHYAHLFYDQDAAGKDRGGLDFPGDQPPTYPDFLYFSVTLGMTFQTSDVSIRDPRLRAVVLLQSVAAFLFNLGVIGFTINILGSTG